jgi:hypothetical protein
MLKINTTVLRICKIKQQKFSPKDKISSIRIRGNYPGMFIFYPWGITKLWAAVVL